MFYFTGSTIYNIYSTVVKLFWRSEVVEFFLMLGQVVTPSKEGTELYLSFKNSKNVTLKADFHLWTAGLLRCFA